MREPIRFFGPFLTSEAILGYPHFFNRIENDHFKWKVLTSTEVEERVGVLGGEVGLFQKAVFPFSYIRSIILKYNFNFALHVVDIL